MDTFFATKKARKSSRVHTCCQLLISYKGFVYIIPMKTKGEVMQAVDQFEKWIFAPDNLIYDSSPKKNYQDMHKFYNDIGTTLRVLEEVTASANKAELYIGLI